MLCILLTECGMFGRYSPVNTKTAVKYTDTAVSLGMVELVALVLEYDRLAQYGKTMREAFRDEELSVVVLGKFNRDVLAVCR